MISALSKENGINNNKKLLMFTQEYRIRIWFLFCCFYPS